MRAFLIPLLPGLGVYFKNTKLTDSQNVGKLRNWLHKVHVEEHSNSTVAGVK